MRKKLLNLCLTALFGVVSTTAWALSEVGGVYQIGTAADLKAFAELVNNENPYANAVLTADIDKGTETYRIGRDGQDFQGVFNGNGHTISYNMDFGTENGAGLFRNVGVHAVIQNLKVQGTLKSKGSYAGAIAGWSSGRIIGCYADVNIISQKEGDATDGGLVGIAYRGTVIENCLAKIDLDGTTTQNCGGVVGWANDKINIVNCLVVSDGSTLDTSNGASANIARNGGNLNTVNLSTYSSNPYANRPAGANYNNYVTNQWGNNNATTVVPLADLADGRICYQLNNDQSKINWVQNIGTDPFPVPAAFGSGQVFASGATGCNGKADGLTYSNSGSVQATAHTFDKYGICTTCGCFNFDGFEFDATDNSVILKTANDLYLAEGWNRVGDGFKLNMKMANDIECIAPDGQQIFNSSNWVDGNFNGQGHTLTIGISDMSITRCVGFIPEHTGTFENVILHGTIKTGADHVGSISGHGRQKSVRNVFSDVTINSSKSGDNTSGGLFGITYESGKVVENCIYAGSVNGIEGTTCLAGFAGWAGDATTYRNCAFLGTLNNAGGDSHTISRNNGNANCINTYFVNLYNSADGATQTTQAVVESGELAYMLNDNTNGLDRFYQLIGTDLMPMPIEKEGALVYCVAADYRCDGQPIGSDVTYSNSSTSTSIPDHTPVDGFCSVCGSLMEDYMTPVDGWFEISNGKQLTWWTSYVNKYADAKARLTADINMTGCMTNFAPAGTAANKFVSEFDGQNHVISNFTYNGGDYSGLFGIIGGGAVIKNFVLDNTCTINGGAFCGIIGGTNGSGDVYLSNLGNEGNVNGSAQNAAGIIGVDMGGSATLHISNCFVTGAIKGGSESATICGWSNSSSVIENCYSIASLEGIYGDGSFTRGSGSVNNCYEIETVGKQTATTKVTAEQVTSGALCYMLNGKKEGVELFYQTIGTDTNPKPFAKEGALVYSINSSYRCDGQPTGTIIGYANAPAAITLPEHDFEDGACNICSAIETDEDGYAKIINAKTMVALATRVNEAGDTDMKARMYTDLDMSGVVYTPVGSTTNLFVGEFDGQGHVVSNLVLDNGAYEYQGLFGIIGDGAIIKNFIFDNTCSIKASRFAGIIGGTNGSGDVYLSKLGNEGHVETINENAAGIIGVDMLGSATLHINNCYVTGSVKGGRESATICGWSNGSSVIQNSYSIASLEGFDKTFSRGGASVENCYEINTVGTQTNTTKVTAEEVANGALCFKLGDPFGQTLGTDAYPNFTGKKVYAIGDGYANIEGINIETATGDADCILPSMRWGGAYQAYTYVAQGDFEYGDWNESNPNYNVIIGTPAEQDGNAWFTPAYDVTGWNYGQDLPEFGDGRPADVYAVRYFTVDGEIPSTLYMPAAHDDAPCEYYINGELIWAETDGWKEDEVVLLTDAQKALIKTDGSINVFAFHVHQNWGGRYADGGLYTAGNMVNDYWNDYGNLDEIYAKAEADGIDAAVIDVAKEKSNYRGGMNYARNAIIAAYRLKNVDTQENIFQGSAPEDGGQYYIYNVGAKRYLTGGVDYGTHAAVNFAAQLATFTANEGGFRIHTNIRNGSDALNYNAFVDCGGDGDTWFLNEVSTGVYTISRNATATGKSLLGYNGPARNNWWQVDSDCEDTSDPNNQWILVSKAERDAIMENATAENPVDATYYIHAAGFDHWLVPSTLAWPQTHWTWNNGGDGGWEPDFVYEVWHAGETEMSQTLEGLPAGKYIATVQGYYRDGDNTGTYNYQGDRQEAYFFAGDAQVLLPNIGSEADQYPLRGNANGGHGIVPDSREDAAGYFGAGLYKVSVETTVGADGKLKIGAYKSGNVANDWMVLDNFRLTYVGNPVDVAISEAGYTTFVAPWNVNIIPSGVEAFAAQKQEGKEFIHLESVAAIPTGEAVVLKGAEGTYTLYANASTAELGAENDLIAATADVTADGSQYILAQLDGEVGFYQATPATTIAAGKGYLVITGSGVKGFYPFSEDDATGISNARLDLDANQVIYNVAGQRIQKMQRGINIVNGVKILK